jgi:hypothetical protein
VEPLTKNGNTASRDAEPTSVESLTQQLGRGLYTEDSLLSSGLMLEESTTEDRFALNFCDTISKVHFGHPCSDCEVASVIPLPDSNNPLIRREEPRIVSDRLFLRPLALSNIRLLCVAGIVILSRQASHSQASNLTGELRAFIETSEWKYSTSSTCYMSLIGATFPNDDPSVKTLNCRVSLTSMSSRSASPL